MNNYTTSNNLRSFINLINNGNIKLEDEIFLRDLISCLQDFNRPDRALCLANYVALPNSVSELAQKQAIDDLRKDKHDILNPRLFLATNDKKLIEKAFNIVLNDWKNSGLHALILLGNAIYSDLYLKELIIHEISKKQLDYEKMDNYKLWEQISDASIQLNSDNWIDFSTSEFINSYPGVEKHNSWVHCSRNLTDKLWKIRKMYFLQEIFVLSLQNQFIIKPGDIHERLISSFVYNAQWNDSSINFAIDGKLIDLLMPNRSERKEMWLSRVSNSPFKSKNDFLRWQLNNSIYLKYPIDEYGNSMFNIVEENSEMAIDIVRCIKIAKKLGDDFLEKKYYQLARNKIKDIIKSQFDNINIQWFYYAASLANILEDKDLIEQLSNRINDLSITHSAAYRIFYNMNDNAMTFKQALLAIIQDNPPLPPPIDSLHICKPY